MHVPTPEQRRRLAAALAGSGAPAAGYHIGPVQALAPAPAAATATATDEDQAEGEQPTAATSADVYVFERIGGWFGMTADDFVRDVAPLDVDQIVLHLNSPGGDAMEGVAIANVLRAHRARIVVRVDGMAASAASVIAMAGDEVIMGIGSQMMIHDAWSYAMGDAAEMRKAADMLDSTSDAMASTYAAKAGGTTTSWRDAMRAESWYTPEEAVDAGLADRVADADETGTAEGEQITPGSSSSWWDMWAELRSPERFDLSAFTYAGRSDAPAPAMPGRMTPAASADGPITANGRSSAVAFTDEQLNTMRRRLDLPADADEAAIVAAIEARPDPQPTGLPDGVVAVEQATLDELRAQARLGSEAHARQQREDRERLVAAAVGDGRIAPARRAHWIAQLEADPGAAETLASLEKGLIPVGAELGHGHETPPADPATGDDYWFPGVAHPATARKEG